MPGDIVNTVKPSILLVTGSMEGGGAQRILSDMANYWACKGWSVSLATLAGRDVGDFYMLDRNVKRYWLDVCSPSNTLFDKICSNINRVRKLRKLICSVKPAVILSFIDVSNVITILACFGMKIPVVVSERTNPGVNHNVTRPWKLLRKITYHRAKIVVAQTRDAARWIEKNCGVRVDVIPNPLRSLPSLNYERESVVLAVGRLSNEKGFDTLLYSFAKISKIFPDWNVVIVGDGPERRGLTELLHRLDLQDKAHILDPVRDIETWMARAGLVVHPSRREGFPNAVLEAMGMGAAVICTDCPSGPSDLIQDGVNGRLIPVDDVEKLTHVMSELMVSPELRQKLGKEALKVREQYNQDLIMNNWESCLLTR